MDSVDTIVVGAGVVGLAAARALARSGQEVIVAEASDLIGSGASSRNSEVVHAGIYYPSGFLKTRLCVQGRQMLYALCEARGVPYRKIGRTFTDRPGRGARGTLSGWPSKGRKRAPVRRFPM